MVPSASTPGNNCNCDSEAVRMLMAPLEIGVSMSRSPTDAAGRGRFAARIA